MKHPAATSGKRISRRDFLKAVALTSAGLPFLKSDHRPLPQTKTAALPNVILIIADALRADHVSGYGYSRTTTPNVDSWLINAGVSFLKATTSAPWTCPANAALATGYSPAYLGVSWDNTTLPPGVTTLAEYLKQGGYFTAGFASAGFIAGGRGFNRGFDYYDDDLCLNTPTSFQGVAGQLTAKALDWLQNDYSPGSQPLFLFLYYFDPHTWYHPLPPYDTLYDSTYTGTLTPEVYRDGQDVVAGLITPTPRDIEHLIALYDGEISYFDNYLGQIMTYLNDQSFLDNALVIFTADHGDIFGTHGQWTHGSYLYQEALQVPLVMRYPGIITPGTTVQTPVQNMDLLPSILDWAGLTIPPDLHAVSLRQLAEGQSVPTRDVFSHVGAVTDPNNPFYWNAPHAPLYAIQRGDWKLIQHPFEPGTDELYPLNAASPYETTNLIQAEPDLAADLRQALFDWFGITPTRTYLPNVLT